MKEKTATIKIDGEVIKLLDSLAVEEERTRSQLIRLAINQFLQNRELTKRSENAKR